MGSEVFMTEKFVSEIDGKELFKKSIIYLITYIICIAGLVQMAMKEIWIGYFIMFILLFIASYALQFQFVSSLMPAVSLNGKSFLFNGTFGGYMKMNLKGLLLSLITFGIYSSWYARDYNCFIADNTEYPDKAISFKGKGGKLFLYMVLGFAIPLVVLVLILTPLYIAGLRGNMASLALAGLIYVVGVFLLAALMSALEYKWMIDYSFGSENVYLDISLWKSVFYIFFQLLLGIITFGVYLFAAEVKIYAYLCDRTKLANPETGAKRHVRFKGSTGEGFILYLGQTLLILITLGLYMPVAFARISNWRISNMEIVEEVVL